MVGKRVRWVCVTYNSTPIGESVVLEGFSIGGLWQRVLPHPRPRVHGNPRVTAWQRHGDTDTRSFQLSFFNSFCFFHTYIGLFKTRSCYQSFYANGASSHSPFSGLPSLPQTGSTTVDPSWRSNRVATGPVEHWPGCGSVNLFPTGVQTVFFQEGDRHMPIAPSSQGRLRLLSGTPQRAMEPLKIATGFFSWQNAPQLKNTLL